MLCIPEFLELSFGVTDVLIVIQVRRSIRLKVIRQLQ
jgi:hypothetical protein